MSLGHNPENEIEFEGRGRCPVCRTYWDYLEFHACTCCPDAVASCRNDECSGVITKSSDTDYSPVGDRLSLAHAAAQQRISRQREAIRAR